MMSRSLFALIGLALLVPIAQGCGNSGSKAGGTGGTVSTGATGGVLANPGSGGSPLTPTGGAGQTVGGTTNGTGGQGGNTAVGGSDASLGGAVAAGGSAGGGGAVVVVPSNNRQDYSLNVGWKFTKSNVTGAEATSFDDSAWTDVSTPHTYNDTDTYTHVGSNTMDGEVGQYAGVAWYRKHFTVPAEAAGRKVFVEFQGVRQRATVYLNGTKLGLSETGFVPFGFDLSANIKAGQDNVLAVQCDNTMPMNASGSSDVIAWHHPHWHPNFGGIVSDVYLHITDNLHVTLPLLLNLQTSGVYVHADNVTSASAPLTVEAQLKNEYADSKSVQITAKVIDSSAAEVLTLNDTQTVAAGALVVSKMTGTLTNPKLWSPASPYLYTVQISLSTGGQLVDVYSVPLGVRYFKFSPSNGLTLNGQPFKLHGWGQKPTNSWAGLGAAVPDWMHEYTMRMMKQANGNFVRWGHSAASPANIRFSDKYGIITLQPGVDAEAGIVTNVGTGTTSGAAWTVRVDAFKSVLTYFRNNPSIFIWEGGNQAAQTSAANIATVRAIKDSLDPTRVFTMRVATDSSKTQYFDVLESTINGEYATGTTLGVFEGEYNRFEAPRRVWDALTPPHTGWTNPANGSQNWDVAEDQEHDSLEQVTEWNTFATNSKHSGGANWHFTDEPTHRRVLTDVSRDSGEVDAVRLPKDSYFALQAMWATDPQVHIVGHWSYPAGTKKTVSVISNCDSVELFVAGTSVGKVTTPTKGFLFSFPNITWQSGVIKAVGTKGGTQVTDQKTSAGAAASIKLTATTAAGGFRADGADIAMIDVEVLDSAGVRVPSDEARVDFTITGPGVWRGGYNSGIANSTNNKYLNTECGINRVFVRSTTTAGAITVTATRSGLTMGTVTVTSVPVTVSNGLSTVMPATL